MSKHRHDDRADSSGALPGDKWNFPTGYDGRHRKPLSHAAVLEAGKMPRHMRALSLAEIRYRNRVGDVQSNARCDTGLIRCEGVCPRHNPESYADCRALHAADYDGSIPGTTAGTGGSFYGASR